MSEARNERTILLLTRTIKYDKYRGNIISDTTTNHLTGETYPTPKKKKEPKK